MYFEVSTIRFVDEELLQAILFRRVLCLNKTVVVLKGELRVDRNYLIFHKDRGIHDLSVSKRILHLVTLRRKHVLKERFQVVLSQNSSLLRVLQNVLKALELVRKRNHLAVRLIEFGETLGNIANELGRLAELAMRRFMHFLRALPYFCIEGTSKVLELLLEEKNPLPVILLLFFVLSALDKEV